MAGNEPSGNVLSAASISKFMLASLPQDGDQELRNPVETIALAAHASMLAVGFRLVGLGEDHRIEAESDPSQPRPLPAEWTASASGGTHAFRYKHGQSSMEFLVKIVRMFDRATITGMALGDGRMCSFTIVADEYVMKQKLPFTSSTSSASSSDEAARSMTELFTSAGRLSDLGSLIRISIIQKLLPSLQKEGYEETSETSSSRQQQQQSDRDPPPERQPPRYDPLRDDRGPPLAQPRPWQGDDPLRIPPRGGPRPLPDPIPGFDDEFELQRPPRGTFAPGHGGPLQDYGYNDLYPAGLGPRDPIRGGIGPGLRGPPGGGGGGMHPQFPLGGEPEGGDGFDPQAPPGSRWDPVGPGMGGHPSGPGRGGRPPNPFGGFGRDDFI